MPPAPIGVEGAIESVRARLEGDVPARLAALGVLYGVVPLGPAPTPARPAPLEPRLYAGQDRDRLEPTDMPALLVVAQATENGVLADPGADGGPIYRWRYLVRTFTAVLGATFEETAAARNRLTLAVRWSLLARPKLTATHNVLQDTVRESYSDVAGVRNEKRSRAMSWVECAVESHEQLPALAPLGVVDTVLIDAEVVVDLL